MSRRRKTGAPSGRRPAGAGAVERPAADSSGTTGDREDARRSRGPSLLVQIALLAGIFAVTTLVAELAGAANLGVAIGIGQIVFALALMAMLLRGP